MTINIFPDMMIDSKDISLLFSFIRVDHINQNTTSTFKEQATFK